MSRKYFLIVLAVIELFALKQWLICVQFADQFHFSAFDLKLRLIEAIHNDGGIPLFIVRLFHNKILGTILDIYTHYINYWNITFLVYILSFVGAFGFLCFIWYLLQKKLTGWLWIPFISSLVLPFIEIILKSHSPFILRFGFIAIPLLIMSFFGWWRYLAGKKIFRYGLFALLAAISLIWILNVPAQVEPMFCYK